MAGFSTPSFRSWCASEVIASTCIEVPPCMVAASPCSISILHLDGIAHYSNFLPESILLDNNLPGRVDFYRNVAH